MKSAGDAGDGLGLRFGAVAVPGPRSVGPYVSSGAVVSGVNGDYTVPYVWLAVVVFAALLWCAIAVCIVRDIWRR